MDKPIAWYDPTNGMVSTDKDSPLFTPLGQVLPLYSQRTWAGLTKEEMHGAFNRALANRRPDRLHWDMAMYIDEILRKKNT